MDVELSRDRTKQLAFWNRLRNKIKSGQAVADEQFDLIYPSSVSRLSQDHWTPVEVAMSAANLLVTNVSDRVLDVGSGCGKFCTVAALTAGAQFVGIEQRAHLLSVARDVSRKLRVPNAKFKYGNMVNLDWSEYDAFYFFNPFYENQFKLAKIDDTVSVSREKFNLYVETVILKLREVKVNTRVVTYHGFGGIMPGCFELDQVKVAGSHQLDLWIKRA